MSAVFCSIGCCPGCQDCYGMSIGCHQSPCRCAAPCSCDLTVNESPLTDGTCFRHDPTHDHRFAADRTDDDGDGDLQLLTPCPECGAAGACSYDDEGRPLIHSISGDDG